MSAGAKQQNGELLTRSAGGAPDAAAALLSLVYDELHLLASAYLRREHAGQTLQPTALIHEAYLRLIDQTTAGWNDRVHFFRAAARTMRNILVDAARARKAAKRGGARERVSLSGVGPAAPGAIDIVELDDLLALLRKLNARHADMVELRFFAGLSIAEAAAALGVSTSTVEEDWAIARAWLYGRLRSETRS